jgi:hypothetical protein
LLEREGECVALVCKGEHLVADGGNVNAAGQRAKDARLLPKLRDARHDLLAPCGLTST